MTEILGITSERGIEGPVPRIDEKYVGKVASLNIRIRVYIL